MQAATWPTLPLLADQAVEIVADRAAARQASQAEWDALCAAMQQAFAAGEFKAGVIAAVNSVANILARPAAEAVAARPGRNELPNTAVLR